MNHREHATRDSDLVRSACARGHRTGEMCPGWPVKIGCYALTKINFQSSNRNVSCESDLCRLHREGFSTIAILPLRAVDTFQKSNGSSAWPQKRRLKVSINAKHFGVRQSLRRSHCRAEAHIFPRGKVKNLLRYRRFNGLAVNSWKTRPVHRRSRSPILSLHPFGPSCRPDAR